MNQTPFGLLLSVGRFVIALGAALSLMGIVVSLFQGRWNPFDAGEIWAMFATFVVSTGVLVLYEIRDALLRSQIAMPAAMEPPPRRAAIDPLAGFRAAIWQTIGALVASIWLPLQPEGDRLLIEHLTLLEQRELNHRLANVAACITAATITPVLIAFALLSPVAVCIAGTAVASNLFILDWFKKRHRQWLYSTAYAQEHSSGPPAETTAGQ